MAYPFTSKPLKHETRQQAPKRQSGGVSRANKTEITRNSAEYYVKAAERVKRIEGFALKTPHDREGVCYTDSSELFKMVIANSWHILNLFSR